MLLSRVSREGKEAEIVPQPRNLLPGVAAHHPATAAAGARILDEGGSAADAAVAATLASCVAETVMTGLAGGGHALVWDAAAGEAWLLDGFVTIPGLGEGRPAGAFLEVPIHFETEVVPYSVGAASVGVPGVPALCEALWQRGGRLPWAQVLSPAVDLARAGVPLPPAHARVLRMLAPVMTMREGAGIYAPGGRLLEAGDVLRQPGLERALALLRDEGAATWYHGTVAAMLSALVRDRGGALGPADLAAYRTRWSRAGPPRAFAGHEVLGRHDLAGALDTLARLPVLVGMAPGERALALARTLGGVPDRVAPGARPLRTPEQTTNVVAVDAEGNACVVTTSLGLGSGDYLPGLDVQLNSMLGEVDLQRGAAVPGRRLGSMMVPTLVLDRDGPVVAAGAAGGSRIRSALVQALSGVLVEGRGPVEAVESPRLHVMPPVQVHAEPGFDPDALDGLRTIGYTVRTWATRHHYFGGVSLISRDGLAADSRRDGLALAHRR